MSLTIKVQTFRQNRKEQGGKEKSNLKEVAFLGCPMGFEPMTFRTTI